MNEIRYLTDETVVIPMATGLDPGRDGNIPWEGYDIVRQENKCHTEERGGSSNREMIPGGHQLVRNNPERFEIHSEELGITIQFVRRFYTT